jgi:hypothetical protein
VEPYVTYLAAMGWWGLRHAGKRMDAMLLR